LDVPADGAQTSDDAFDALLSRGGLWVRLCAGQAATKHAGLQKVAGSGADLSPFASLAQMAHFRAFDLRLPALTGS